jgi:DNA repair exonuclease SbcCD ATPase subunit
MNEEALQELARSQDLMGGLDEAEKKLAQGDVEGAMKALDQMASAMDQMVAGLQRTAGLPDEKAAALMKDMLAFKDQLEKVETEQKKTAAETEKVRSEYRKKAAERMKDAEKKLAQLADKAKEAREDLDRAQHGVSMRAEPEYEQAREAVRDLQRALEMREVDGAAEAVMRAQPSVERLAQFLEEDAQLGERSEALTGRDPDRIADAQKNASRAAPKVREIRDALSQLLPDPRSVLGKEDQKRLGELAKHQGELEQQAGQLQQQLRELAEKAPVFPPSAQDQLGESRGHMGQAAAELGAKNPQRGRGEQELALDALGRLKKGLEDAARQQQGGQGGQGFPFPFAEASGENGGEGMEPSHEKVKIPGAEAHRVPEEFRKDLLEAMKQGAPERYRGEVQRYYEELVK